MHLVGVRALSSGWGAEAGAVAEEPTLAWGVIQALFCLDALERGKRSTRHTQLGCFLVACRRAMESRQHAVLSASKLVANWWFLSWSFSTSAVIQSHMSFLACVFYRKTWNWLLLFKNQISPPKSRLTASLEQQDDLESSWPCSHMTIGCPQKLPNLCVSQIPYCLWDMEVGF